MDTAAGFARFIALNGATLLAACAVASRLHFETRSQRLLAACVIAVGIANVSALGLGLAGYLHYGPLLALQVVLAVVACGGARRRVMAELLDPRSARTLLEGGSQVAAVVLLLFAYAYALFLGFVSETFAGDELMYHLPLVAGYARDGAITIPELGRFWGSQYWAYYPGGAYLLYQWFVLPFGSAWLVDLVQLPYAFATALATYVLARGIGAQRRDALWAAILFLAVPIVLGQVKTVLVDVTLSFLYSAGFAFLLATKLTPTGIVLAAIAWGAAPAVKLPAMMYLGLGAVCVALTQFDRERSVGAALRRLVPIGTALGLGVLLLSGYWFARNYWLMGSAVYPLNLHPEPGPSWSNILVYGLFFPLLDASPIAPNTFNYETGGGPQFMCLGVPALLAYAVASWRERRLGGIAFALIPILAYFAWLLRLSTSVQTLLRYVLPAMPLAFAAFAWLLSRTSRRSWLVGLALGSVAFSLFLAVPRVGSYTTVSALRTGLVKWRRGDEVQRFDVMGAVDLQDYRRTWKYVDALPGRHDLALSHIIFAYPLMGADFRNHLHFIDATRPQPWMDELRQSNIDHVAVAQLVDETGLVKIGAEVQLEFRYSPATDESLQVGRNVEPRDVEAIRLRYRSDAAENARFLVGTNRFREVWELPLPPPGEERTETIPWKGRLSSVDFDLDHVARTSLRVRLQVSLASVEVQEADGNWIDLPNSDAASWQVLDWPLEYYWMEAHPERFKLVLRDFDSGHSRLSGELRLYEVRPAGGARGVQG